MIDVSWSKDGRNLVYTNQNNQCQSVVIIFRKNGEYVELLWAKAGEQEYKEYQELELLKIALYDNYLVNKDNLAYYTNKKVFDEVLENAFD